MPQACGVLDLIGRYGRDFIPIPRRTERYWWSVSCLPATPGKALVRVNASWMELFSIHADGADLRGTFLVHLSDFTSDRSPHRASVDQDFLERSVVRAEDVSMPTGQSLPAPGGSLWFVSEGCPAGAGSRASSRSRARS